MNAAVASLNAWGSAWSGFMLRGLVDATALLILLSLAWLPLRRRISAQFAHGLFLLVLLKAAVPIPWAWPWSAEAGAIGRRAVAAVAAWAAPGHDDRAPAAPAAPAAPEPAVVAWAPEPIVAAAQPKPAPEPAPAPAARGDAPRPKPAPARVAPSIPAALMLGWAGVAAALLARLAWSVASTRRLFRHAMTVPEGSGWFAVDFEGLRRTSGVRAPVRWAVSQGLTSPAVGGLLRPTVVMPPDLDEGLTAQQLRWVLLHELAHIRRGDLWVVIGQRLASACFFFHPAVHAANWAIDQLREYACDDAALLAVQASRRTCGEGFLTIVCRVADRSSPPAAALGLFESQMLIRRRLVRILDTRRPVQARLSGPALALLVAIGLVILPSGRPGDARAGLSRPPAPAVAAPRPGADEPRLFAPGATVVHDDRAEAAGRPRPPVLAVACSPDGRTLASAAEDASIVLRDPATGATRLRLAGHEDAVTCLAFSPDGSTLASAGYDRTVRLWDPATGRPRATLPGHDRWVFALAFAPDGKTLASAGSDRAVRLWDVAAARPAGVLAGAASAIRALAFSPDGETLASAGADRAATLWSVAGRAVRASLIGHRGTIRGVTFAPDGATLATAGEDGEVKLWDARTGRERAALTGHSDMVLALAFSPSGATVASGGQDGSIRLWDVRAGRERSVLSGHGEGVAAVAFAPDGRRLASGGQDGTVRVWEPAAPTLSAAFTLDYPGEPAAVAFAPDGRTLFASGTADHLVAYDPHDGIARPRPAGTPAGAAMATSPDGRTVALAGPGATIRLVDAATRREVAAWDDAGAVRALAFARGGSVLVSGGPAGATWWDVATRSRIAARPGPVDALVAAPDGRTVAALVDGRVARLDAARGGPAGDFAGADSGVAALAFDPAGAGLALAGPGGAWFRDPGGREARAIATRSEPKALAYSPDGRFLALGQADGEVGLWEVATGTRIAALKGHGAAVAGVCFDPGGRRVASAGRDGTVRLWDLDARRITPRASLNGDLSCAGPVAVSPDGSTLATAEVGRDSAGRIAVWDVAARRVRATLPGHPGGVISLAFGPDGRTLLSSGADRSVRRWDARDGRPLGEFVATEAVVALALSPDGKTLAGGGEDRSLTLWDVEGQSELARVDDFRGVVCTLAFSPDGSRLATGGGRDGHNGRGFGEVRILDAHTLEREADLAGHAASVRAVRFAPDGATLATGSADASVRLWDLATGQARLVLGGFPDCVRALEVSPDGRSLAVSGRGDGVVSLFGLAHGGELARLVGHGRPVLGLGFTPDGRTLATGSLDASVKLWDMPAAAAVAKAR